MSAPVLQPVAPEKMLADAVLLLDSGMDPDRLLAVAAHRIEHYAQLAEEYDAGRALDGRASIYTGETYAEARERWDTYRGLLVEHLRGPDGGRA